MHRDNTVSPMSVDGVCPVGHVIQSKRSELLARDLAVSSEWSAGTKGAVVHLISMANVSWTFSKFTPDGISLVINPGLD